MLRWPSDGSHVRLGLAGGHFVLAKTNGVCFTCFTPRTTPPTPLFLASSDATTRMLDAEVSVACHRIIEAADTNENEGVPYLVALAEEVKSSWPLAFRESGGPEKEAHHERNSG